MSDATQKFQLERRLELTILGLIALGTTTGIFLIVVMILRGESANLVAVLNAAVPLVIAFASLSGAAITLYNAVMIRTVHKLTNSSYTEAKAMRDAASEALEDSRRINGDLRVQIAELISHRAGHLSGREAGPAT